MTEEQRDKLIRKEPFFTTNREWFTAEINEQGGITYKLTDKAPQTAINSFNEWQELINSYDDVVEDK